MNNTVQYLIKSDLIKSYTKILALFSLVLLTNTPQSFGQAYEIEATIKGIRDTSLVLGHFSRNSNQFLPKDTAAADAQGHMVFRGDKPLPGGLYVILFPGNSRFIQMVYSEKETRFSMLTDTVDLIGSMKIKGSKENELFYSYQKELNDVSKGIEALKQGDPNNGQKVKDLQEGFKNFREKFLVENAGTFTVQLLKMSADPEIPPAPIDANGKTDSLWAFNYYKAHYWDHFDFTDPRILNTPFVEPRLERYMKNLVVQNPDSIILDSELLIEKAKVNPTLREYIIFYITSQYENPATVGTEGVWIHMAKKYYLGGEMTISEDVRKRISEKVKTLTPLLVNSPFPPLDLTTSEGKPVHVKDLNAKYSVLFFYSPTCGHCKESAPKVKAFYDKNKKSGVALMAISIDHNVEEWNDFITKFNFQDIINAFDATKIIDFYRTFDVVSTPMVYILDRNKKIIARKMPVEQIEDFLQFYENKIAPKSN